MITQYTYAGFTTPCAGDLPAAIEAAIAGVTVIQIISNSDTNESIIEVDPALTAGEKTTLDGIISAWVCPPEGNLQEVTFDASGISEGDIIEWDGNEFIFASHVPGEVDFDRQQVQTNTDFATSSQTPVDITSTTLTTKNLGDVGHYIVRYSCEFEYNQDSEFLQFSLSVGGATVLEERTAGVGGKNVSWRNFSMTHLAPSVASGTVIKMQVLTEDGEDLVIASRELVIDGVLSDSILT
jgi:hypothetical protein